MLRGSYAGGSPNVTARCPDRRSGPSAHPACPRPGSSSRTESARDASRSRCRRFAKSRLAGPCPRHSRLCYSSAVQCLSLPSHGKAEQSKAFAFHRGASCRNAIAAHRLGSLSPSVASLRFAAPCRSVASRSLRCLAFPPHCRAVLRRGRSLHLKATAPLRPAKPCLRRPYQSIAVARRGFASPSPRAALLRSAVAVLVASRPSCPMPLRRASLPVLHGAVRCFAPPLPGLALLCLSVPSPF